MRSGLILSGLVLGALGLAACESDEPHEAPGAAPTVDVERIDADPAMSQTTECINRIEGYAVAYPVGWHVNTGELSARVRSSIRSR